MNDVFYYLTDEQEICPETTAWGELAWHINDYESLLTLLHDKKSIVLGGDILDFNMDHTYDNWHYDDNSELLLEDNVKSSISVARNYLSSYIKSNGDKYYVVFVLR